MMNDLSLHALKTKILYGGTIGYKWLEETFRVFHIHPDWKFRANEQVQMKIKEDFDVKGMIGLV